VRILFDQGTPAPLRKYLANHEVKTAAEMGWSRLTNGQLLDAAEKTFDLLITSDQQLREQQNLASRNLQFWIRAAGRGLLALPIRITPQSFPLSNRALLGSTWNCNYS
jgi:hypothetical protein